MWNPKNQIEKMQPVVTAFVKSLKSEGVEFMPTDGENNNVVFIKGDKTAKMSHHSFYRFSGIATITRDKKGENNQSENVPVTDEQYLDVFIRPIVHKLLSA